MIYRCCVLLLSVEYQIEKLIEVKLSSILKTSGRSCSRHQINVVNNVTNHASYDYNHHDYIEHNTKDVTDKSCPPVWPGTFIVSFVVLLLCLPYACCVCVYMYVT